MCRSHLLLDPGPTNSCCCMWRSTDGINLCLSPASPDEHLRSDSQLSSIKALSGNPGQTSFIMGSITQPEDGRYYLEDLSASIPIDLTDAVTTTGFYTGVPV